MRISQAKTCRASPLKEFPKKSCKAAPINIQLTKMSLFRPKESNLRWDRKESTGREGMIKATRHVLLTSSQRLSDLYRFLKKYPNLASLHHLNFNQKEAPNFKGRSRTYRVRRSWCRRHWPSSHQTATRSHSLLRFTSKPDPASKKIRSVFPLRPSTFKVARHNPLLFRNRRCNHSTR